MKLLDFGVSALRDLCKDVKHWDMSKEYGDARDTSWVCNHKWWGFQAAPIAFFAAAERQGSRSISKPCVMWQQTTVPWPNVLSLAWNSEVEGE